MLVEVRPGSFLNKGGELMMRAIASELGGDVGLVTEPWIAPYPDRARLGLLQKLWVRRLGPAASLPARLIPGRVRGMFGVVAESQIAAVLDASGFRYTDDDRWGSRSARELAANATRWRRQGKTIILLPQAIGPFRSPAVRDPFLRAFDAVDLVYVRDRTSLEHLRGLGRGDERVRLAPDFTIVLPGRRPPDLADRVGAGPFVCIVPNDRMLERTSPEVAGRYVAFLADAIELVRGRGLEPVVLLHEVSKDRAFADRLEQEAGRLRVVVEPDPLVLKGIIGEAQLVVGSRFHALVSALSQAVPVLATGWSHKYRELLEDYGRPEDLVDPRLGRAELEQRLDRLIDPTERERVASVLRDRGAELRATVEAMWAEIRLRLALPARVPPTA